MRGAHCTVNLCYHRSVIVECPSCRLRYDVSGRAPGTQARCRCGAEFKIPAAAETARAMGCPQCGASVGTTEAGCGYCGAKLAKQSCPSCFGMIFAGARHCPHCGTSAAEGAEPLPRGESRRCPRCPGRPALMGQLVAEVMLDFCPECSGTFVDSVTLNRVVRDRDQQARIQTALVTSSASSAGGAQKVVYLKCPQCAQLMQRKNYGKRSGVIVDLCGAHGVWFDADELRRVVEFVQGGGLDRARQQEIEELERQVRHKRQMLQDSPKSSYEARVRGNLNSTGSVVTTFELGGALLGGLLDLLD
jgi:Zn-finger nucleic acid-binding protein